MSTVFGVTRETIIRRILRTFDAATAADVEAGATWYDEARTLADTLGRTSGLGTERVAAVISHLSPRTTWARNVSGAIYAVTYGEQGPGIMSANYGRARAALETDGPIVDTFGGPKTRAFFLNIFGDDEAVTVDVWACRVADLDEALLKRAGAYDMVADCYRTAARRRGVLPTTMQATTWIVARNGRKA